MVRTFAFAFLLLFALAPGSAGARSLTIADMAGIVGLDKPAISPDGRTIAVLVDRQDTVRATNIVRLMLLDARSGATVATIPASDPSVPRWSRNGLQLGFLAGSHGTRQVFTFSANVVVQRTHAAADVIDFAWSPDGKTIAFAATDVPANAAAIAAHHDYFFAGNNDYTATALTPPVHLWTVAANGGVSRRLTSGSWTIAPTDPGGIFSPQIAWSARRQAHRTDARRLHLQRRGRIYDALERRRCNARDAQDYGTSRRRTEPFLLARRAAPRLLVAAQRRFHGRKHRSHSYRRCRRDA